MAKHIVAPLKDFPAGTRKLVDVNGRQIAVFNVDGEFHALGNRCPHEGGLLIHGQLVGLVESSMPGEYRYSRKGEVIKCPWHGWEFDLRTGRAQCDPARIRVRRYETAVVQGGDLDVDAPPKAAEVFAVRVEDDYVIVEV
jgi:nitrite reductase/ring-hydroxylating ferredoxin subunit